VTAVIATALDQSGYVVNSAASGEEALSFWKATPWTW
jgi:CheY-like chemotaxis protein